MEFLWNWSSQVQVMVRRLFDANYNNTTIPLSEPSVAYLISFEPLG